MADDELLLRVQLEPGLPEYRRRVLALVLESYPGVLHVHEVNESELEDILDFEDLKDAIRDNAGKPLVDWEDVEAELAEAER